MQGQLRGTPEREAGIVEHLQAAALRAPSVPLSCLTCCVVWEPAEQVPGLLGCLGWYLLSARDHEPGRLVLYPRAEGLLRDGVSMTAVRTTTSHQH
jgi:hypothetical protein